MSQRHSEKECKELVARYFRGRITRRRFIQRATKLGISAALLSRIVPPTYAVGENLVESAPESPNESPITKERIEFLKSKPYKGVTIDVLVLKATVGDCLKYHAPKWSDLTGGHVNVAEVPIDTLHQQIFSDLSTGLGRYDTYMTAAWFYGDFFTGKEPYILEIEPFLKDPKHPYWDPNQWIPAIKTLYIWEGKLYGVLFGSDCQILYYRRDVFAKPENQQKFKEKLGYDLPNPPKTMKDMHDLATFFTGWDWNGDGQKDWGISLHAKVNEQGFFHFLTLSAPYVISPDNKYYFFNPDTMKPLINSEGHVRALEEYVKFLPSGPKEQFSWTLGQGWNLFLAGHAVMEPTWGYLPTLAQDPKSNATQGKIGACVIPGTTEAFNPIAGEWKRYDLNVAGNVNGGTWHCVISRFSKQKEATYDFLAYMANPKNATFNSANGWTGVQPGMKFQFFPPIGTGSLDQWAKYGWNKDDATRYLAAYYANLTLPNQQPYLRIPGAAEYWHELDVRVSAVLAGQTAPKAALDDTAQAWEQITERYGRDSQKKLYQGSFAG